MAFIRGERQQEQLLPACVEDYVAVDDRVGLYGSWWHSKQSCLNSITMNDLDDPNRAREMQVTVTLKKVSVGTELSVLQEGVPAEIPAEACYLGWQESPGQLAQLVEPEIRTNP